MLNSGTNFIPEGRDSRENPSFNEFSGAFEHSDPVTDRPATDDYVRLVMEADISVRHNFVKKVFALLFVQLLITFSLILGFSGIPSWRDYAGGVFIQSAPGQIQMIEEPHMWIIYIGLSGFFGSVMALACFPSTARRHPHGLMILSFLSLCNGLYIGGALARDASIVVALNDDSLSSTSSLVLMAVGITLLLVGALSVFALQTKWDFTGHGPYLVVGLHTLLLVMSFSLLFNYSATDAFIAWIGIVLFSCYVVYDVQLILGGKGRYQHSVDDYVLATLSLYLDVINLFIRILHLLGRSTVSIHI